MDGPHISLSDLTPQGITLFLIALADGLLDAERRGLLAADAWAIEIQRALTPAPRQIERLTMDDVASAERLFSLLRNTLALRRQCPYGQQS